MIRVPLAHVLAGLAAATAAIGGTVLAQQNAIVTDQARIEVRETPQANVVTITDIERSAGGAIVDGRTRSYTEAR